MNEPTSVPRRRRAGAMVVVLAASAVALHTAASHPSPANAQPVWHQVFDIGSACLIVAAIALLVFIVARKKAAM